jgi:hypothetical protein
MLPLSRIIALILFIGDIWTFGKRYCARKKRLPVPPDRPVENGADNRDGARYSEAL